MMFKLLVMRVRGLMASLFMDRSLLTAQQLLRSAKLLRAKSTQESQVAAQEQRQPVKSKTKHKPKVAQSTSAVASRKAAQKPAQTTTGNLGQSSKTPASPIRLPVKPAVKAKAARVPSIKAALLSQLERVPALTLTEAQSGELGQAKATARKTRQPASQVQTTKQKAADSTLAGKKTTRSKTSVQTRTVRQSKARGS
jgi:hypothetical protein